MARPETPDRGLAVPTSGITSAQLVELCAPCHSRRAELGDYDHGGRLLMDHMLPSLLSEGLYYPDGQQQDEVYTYASFLQSKMYARGVRCSDCHDSHSLKLKRDGNEVCLQCHVREVFDGPEHHFHKKTVDGRPSDGALCARCHMPKRTYMVVDPRSDHSFRRPRPDLTAEIGTPNACTQAGCHADKPLSYSLNAYRKWYGQARRPHFGTTFAAAREGRSEAAPELLRLVEDALQPGIVRATALALLERYRGEAATRALRRALLSDEPLLRQVAASSFALPDPRERVAALAPLLLDPVKAVRLAAVGALAGAPRDELKPYQREAFDQGLAEYRAAMAYSLDFASSGLNLGNLHASLGQPGEAEKYYRLALKVDDLFYPAKMNLAVLLSGRGRGAEAEALLREVVARYPENADARYSLGLLLVELGKPEEAAGHLRAAAFAMPRNARARYNLGLLLDQLGRSDEALLWLARALDLDPTSADCLHALAGLELKRDRPQRALAFAERLVAAHPELPVGRELKDAAERALRSRPAR
jgi:predicted CXXCH cytochrome family protein